MVGIVSFGGYVPKLRLQRSAIAEAHTWSNPAAASRGKGERSMCNWDEDAVTMGVEAVRDCINSGNGQPDSLFFASTSLPFADRQNAGIISTALSLGEDLRVLDVTASQRAGTSALLQAFASVASGQSVSTVVVGSDHRRTRASGTQEMTSGDGAAAVEIGNDNPVVEFLGSHSRTVDFVDHFKGEGEEFDYNWEERWIRDEGYKKIVPPTIASALEKTGVSTDSVDHFIMPSTIGRATQGVARSSGIAAEAIRDNLHSVCGDTGVAHPLLMLLHLLETDAKSGDIILLVGFGQGADALVLRVTDALADFKVERGVVGSLENRREENNYQKFLAFNNLVTLEKGMRAEKDPKTALTVLFRKRDMVLGLVGGKCNQCGTAQFPRQDICVNPECHARHSQEPYSFVEEPCEIQSWSADYLTYTVNPPSHYGMVTFDNGGRFMADITDVSPGEIEVGTRLKMVFRIKEFDRNRGFVRYFWKGVPV
ncbi:MAG: OB-fold domain-containing protein [Gammaproteobacteria bacterium]|nr:OB-fold domain-containing protein [Gammaproteobacteria bacterium]